MMGGVGGGMAELVVACIIKEQDSVVWAGPLVWEQDSVVWEQVACSRRATVYWVLLVKLVCFQALEQD